MAQTQPDQDPVTVSVRILGALSKPAGKAEFVHPIVGPLTIAGLLEQLGYPPQHRRFIVAVLNGTIVTHDRELVAGDELKLTLPVGGG